MKIMFKHILVVVFLILSVGAFAQTFKATLISGLNAGQIDGDFEVGYNKLGYTGGIGIGIDLSQNMYLGTEFLFSQRGSKNALFDKTDEANGSIHLNYIELPFVYKIFDWYEETDDYYKVWAEGGISPARLITSKITGSDKPELVNEFRLTDVSWFLGGGYYFTKNLNFSIRYTRSFFPFYVAENPQVNEVENLISYFITVRVGYTL